MVFLPGGVVVVHGCRYRFARLLPSVLCHVPPAWCRWSWWPTWAVCPVVVLPGRSVDHAAGPTLAVVILSAPCCPLFHVSGRVQRLFSPLVNGSSLGSHKCGHFAPRPPRVDGIYRTPEKRNCLDQPFTTPPGQWRWFAGPSRGSTCLRFWEAWRMVMKNLWWNSATWQKRQFRRSFRV